MSSFLLLSFLLILNPLKVNRKANFWFGIFIFLWSTFWVDEIFFFLFKHPLNLFVHIFINFIQFLTPLAFYFSIKLFTNPDTRFTLKNITWLFMPILFLITLILQYNFGNYNIFQIIFLFLTLSQALLYTIYSYFRIKKHKKKIVLFKSNIEEVDLRWIEYIILTVLIGYFTDIDPLVSRQIDPLELSTDFMF
jgi:hypothetical protein